MYRLLLQALAAALLTAGAPTGAQPPRSLTLDEAWAELDAQNLTLAQARARAEAADAFVRQAWAPLLPTLAAAGSYTRNSEAAVAPIGSVVTALLPPGTPIPPVVRDILIQPLQLWNANGVLRVPLLQPSAWADLAQARHGAAQAAAALEAVRLQIRAALLQAAWGTLAGEDIVSASVRALESAREQARSAERALGAGTGVPLSVLQARTEAMKRESDVVRARAELDRARLAAGVLLGKPEPVRITLQDPVPPAALDAPALGAEALQRRPELRAAAEAIAAAERQLDSARLRVVPQLAAVGSAFVQNEPSITGKEEGWRATVELSWTLYDGGFRYGKAHQAQAAIAEARAAAEAQRVAVIQDVEDAARDVRVAVERLRLATDQQRVAAEAAATARRSFAGGVASSLDVLDANDRLFQSEVGLADARARLGIALASLDRAVGRT